jgi:hypothetical protein
MCHHHNQVAAFREYLKVRETQNTEVMKHTAKLDGYLNDQRSGKPVRRCEQRPLYRQNLVLKNIKEIGVPRLLV